MNKGLIPAVLALAAMLVLAGCEGDNPLGSKEKIGYFPSNEGAKWVYKTTPASGASYTTTDTINGTRNINSQRHQIMENVRSIDTNYIRRSFFMDDNLMGVTNGGYEKVENGTIIGSGTVPGLTVSFIYPLEVGSQSGSWSSSGFPVSQVALLCMYYDDDDMDGDGIIDNLDITIEQTIPSYEDITVPAGTFKKSYCIEQDITLTLHLSSLGDKSTSGVRKQWFAPYVGFVKRTISLDMPSPIADLIFTEELQSYDLKD